MEELQFHLGGGEGRFRRAGAPASPERKRRDSEKVQISREVKVAEEEKPIREWDRDKIRQSRSRSRSVDKRRSEERKERQKEREIREQKRGEGRGVLSHVIIHIILFTAERENEKEKAEPPAKLLDDLFRKTKATPCVYWLPLTAEQVSMLQLSLTLSSI